MRSGIFQLVLSGILALVSGSTYANPINEYAKFLAEDGETSDWLGKSISISGNTVIVGAPISGFGIGSGGAYLFDVSTAKQLFALLPNDGAVDDRFGTSVAISGNTTIVGASQDDDNGDNSGSAYLFDVTTGLQLMKLTPSDAEQFDSFGSSVAINGPIAIVGAPIRNNGDSFGVAYLFDATTGQELFKLIPDVDAGNNLFGFSVAINESFAVVGDKADDENGDGSGVVYVFDTNTGKQLFKMSPADPAAGDQFGNSVGISGTIAIVGAPFKGDKEIGTFAGAAYLFDLTTGLQLFKLLPRDLAASDQFGASVSISGITAIAGSVGDTDNGDVSGAAYLFDATTGQQLAKLLASDGGVLDAFGTSVAVSETTATVGAIRDDDANFNAGAAYLFNTSICPSDVNGDELIDAADLGVLLDQFGAAESEADINCDGAVDTADLGLLLGVFGTACP